MLHDMGFLLIKKKNTSKSIQLFEYKQLGEEAWGCKPLSIRMEVKEINQLSFTLLTSQFNLNQGLVQVIHTQHTANTNAEV